MLRGTPISARPAPCASRPPVREEEALPVPRPTDRLLNTAEANAFLGRAKGFLEKRRSSGIDSPPYIQRTKRGAVLYRVSDLLVWEDAFLCTASSDHDGVRRRSGATR